jgi:hypothetical protein
VRARLNLDPARWGVRTVAEIGVALALAAILGQVRLFVMPQGGSVSLELLPVIFIAVRRGVVPGLVTGPRRLFSTTRWRSCRWRWPDSSTCGAGDR